MAPYRTKSHSPQGSLSPASTYTTPSSHNASPATPTSQLAPTTTAASGSSSTRTTSRNTSNDIVRPVPAGKGGCWTCRLRRKKCDERRENDACHTCRRLNIECLGWGPKRPDWMRDKQSVNEYKAKIKAQLTRTGMIRGQPRTQPVRPLPPSRSHTTSGATNSDSTSALFSIPHPSSADHSPLTPAVSQDYPNPGRHGYPAYFDPGPSQARPSYPPPRNQSHSTLSDMYLPEMPGQSNSTFHLLPAASHSEPNLNAFDFNSESYFVNSSIPAPQEPVFDMSSLEFFVNSHHNNNEHVGTFAPNVRNNVYPPLSTSEPSRMTSSSPHPPFQSSWHADHMKYFFDSVFNEQYLFATLLKRNMVYSIVKDDPSSALASAICALASQHFTRGHLPHPSNTDDAIRFFSEACTKLELKHGLYDELDAFAAVHLVKFCAISKGARARMEIPMEVAYDWIAQLGLALDDTPAYTISRMGDVSRLVVKSIIWLDVVFSVRNRCAPRYLTLYRRIFSEQFSLTPNDGTGEFERVRIGMEELTGCPDAFVMTFAETSALAEWKNLEMLNSSLSVKELARRGDLIERQLRVWYPELGEEGGRDDGWQSSPEGRPIPLPSLGANRKVVARLYEQNLLVYLHVALSNIQPGAPEISAPIDEIKRLAKQLPTDNLHFLLFPAFFTGATDEEAREYFGWSRERNDVEGVSKRVQAVDPELFLQRVRELWSSGAMAMV